MDLDLPFKIGYAGPDDQAICKTCLLNFIPDELRIAEMVQSQHHDEKDPVWFHSRCFFTTHQTDIKLTNHIENFENIKYDDQLEIMMKIDPNSADKFKKNAEKPKTEASECFKHFGVEYASNNTDSCSACRILIKRNQLRIKKIVYDTAAEFGKTVLWFHFHCLTSKRYQIGYLWGGKLLTGFNELQPENQVIIEEKLPAIIAIQVEAKKPQLSETLRLEEDLEMKIARQTFSTAVFTEQKQL